jgi:outer membrane receptor for ferrienterochelin and colicins
MKNVRNIVLKSIFLLFILILFTLNSKSQILDSLLSEEISLEELLNFEVVSASRKAQTFKDAPGSVIIINSDMIRDRGYRNMTEIFEDIPGFDFTTKQPSGEYPTNNIFRGITDVGQTNIMILVDGLIRNDVSNGWCVGMGFEYPLIDVDRIEFISGPGSALYGANAYAGLINIITKNSNESNYEIRMTYGSYNTISPEVLFNKVFDNGLKIQLAGQLYFTDGDGGVDRYDPGNYFHNNYETRFSFNNRIRQNY